MTKRYINLFMWGYQEHFRLHIRTLAKNMFEHLGANVDIDILLVGVRKYGSQREYPVCIEPEDGKWQLSIFDNLHDDIKSKYDNHELQNIFYSDSMSMREKPEIMHRDAMRMAILDKLKQYDAEHDVTSFCRGVWLIDEYYVAPVLQISNSVFNKYQPLKSKPRVDRWQATGHLSLIHSSINAVLSEAIDELRTPEPGRSVVNNSMRNVNELVCVAAKNFMHTPGIAIEERYIHSDLYEKLNVVSSLMYEGTKGIGRMLLVNPDNPYVSFIIRLAQPVPFEQHRWVRKVLQMATKDIFIIADSKKIYGLGQLLESYNYDLQDAFFVDFIDHYFWELRCGENILVRCRYGEPKLPQEPFKKSTFVSNYKRIFSQTSDDRAQEIWELLTFQAKMAHGSMIVIAEDAQEEAIRLVRQGSVIEPTKLTKEILQSVSGIDGTILLDSSGVCHAIGVILDGEANNDCTPSRGSRFNSAVRYVKQDGKKRLAIVVSEDRTIDIVPQLRPLIQRELLEKHIGALEIATIDNYHEPRNWLEEHRFYATAEHCERINKALDRLDKLPREIGLLYLLTSRFKPHPEMEDSYFINKQ